MLNLKRNNVLSKYGKKINQEKITQLIQEKETTVRREFWQKLREAMNQLPSQEQLIQRNKKLDLNFQKAEVCVGQYSDLNEKEHQVLEECIKYLIPWRKGPFEIFGHKINSEWRSDFKWQRLERAIGALSGKKIADIGCNNGYYIWRMLGKAEEQGKGEVDCIIGIDPSEYFYYGFHLLQHFIQSPKVDYLMLGVENMDLFPEFFDCIFCLGIIYHQKDPLGMLQEVKNSMAKNAKLIIETQCYPGDDAVAFFAPDRYCKARNTYFIPTVNCLKNWLHRVGFKEIELISEVEITKEEQRKTELAPYESLEDFLDPQDSSKTIEGFLAPKRVIVVCGK